MKTAGMNARQILQKTLDLLGPNGEHWCKHAYKTGDGSFCSYGALCESVLNDPDRFHAGSEYTKARLILATQVKLARPNWKSDIIDFNDNTETTFADVRRVFQKAINRAAHRVIYKVA